MKAFGTAIFLIFAILLAQFNKLTSVGLVLTAVVLSTFGVLLGLLIMGQPFGVVMTGIGVIANAGVIVNNNIVLIDTYDRLRREGVAAYEAILETCRERARPVVLTAVTAILGVLPIAFGMNIEFSHARDHGRRAGDAVVDQPLDRDRVRPRLRDRAHADRDAGRADGDREPARVAPALVGGATGALRPPRAGVSWETRTLGRVLTRPNICASKALGLAKARPNLLRRNPRVLHHLRPFLDLGRDQAGELVRRAGQRRDRERVHLVLGFRPLDEVHQHAVELVDDRPRRCRPAPPPRTSRRRRSRARPPPRWSAGRAWP